MTYLEQPWQSQGGRPDSATRTIRRRRAQQAVGVLELDEITPRWYRPAFIIFGGWLVSTGVTFAYMEGTIHPYYTVALAPAIGALAGIGSNSRTG